MTHELTSQFYSGRYEKKKKIEFLKKSINNCFKYINEAYYVWLTLNKVCVKFVFFFRVTIKY